MDTFCIPVRPEDAFHRAQAIDRMTLVYAVADRVLVLDAGLETARLAPSAPAESAARIASSTWMSRSWTLQEGVLARSCFFQFIDGAIEPAVHYQCDFMCADFSYPEAADCSRVLGGNSAWDKAKRKDHRGSPSYLEWGLLKMFAATADRALRPTGDNDIGVSGLAGVETRSQRFTNVWNALALRSTSMQSDLYVILANLLHYSTALIAAASVHERMRSILAMTEELPIGLLFNGGPRLGANANEYTRWIPFSPSSCLIKDFGVMRFMYDRLWLDSDHAQGNLKILLLKGLKRCNEVYIPFKFGEVVSLLRLTARQSDDDRFQLRGHEGLCYIINWDLVGNEDDKAGKQPWQNRLCAARLAVAAQRTDREWHGLDSKTSAVESRRIRAVYDCPIEARWIPGDAIIPPRSDVVVFDVEDARLGIEIVAGHAPWRMEIDSRKSPLLRSVNTLTWLQDSKTAPQQLKQRPELENGDVVANIRILLTFGPFALWQVLDWASLIIWIVIAIDLGWRGTTTLYKSSLIFNIPGNLFDRVGLLSAISAAMFLVDRVQANALQRIDIAWTVVTFARLCVSTFTTTLYLAVEVMLQQALYLAYDEGWPEVKGWSYVLTYGAFDIVQKGLERLGFHPKTWGDRDEKATVRCLSAIDQNSMSRQEGV
nr:hypothetical protein B0A51_03485 [Rachicladosporium sp. CCFEE 5018]